MQKADNKFLQLINACIAHELRNPLQSIKAMNLEKAMLYKQIRDFMKESGFFTANQERAQKLQSFLKKLEQGLKIQNSSADFMELLL